ncbi:fas-binding factor 1 [Mantella aurantiaca]
MASKNKKGLKGSIDDVLGDLLGDDDPSPPRPHRTSPLTPPSANNRQSALPSAASRKSALNKDFFREMAKESAEDSDVSDADPQALLDSLKDLDELDAEIFRKPKSAPAKDSGLNGSSAGDLKTQNKTGAKNGTFPPQSEKKPHSAPARPYKKFSFDELNDPLDDLLADEDIGFPKKSKAASAKSESVPIKSQPVSAKTNDSSAVSPARPHPGTRRKDDLNFEEDGDDIMDALGFDDGPRSSQKAESSSLKPARSKMDELLGRGTSPKLLERPATGEKKEFKLDPKYQKMPEKEDPLSDENFAFGSYQPSIAMSPEGRPSRRSSVRFSGDGNENVKSDARSLIATPMARSPAHGAKSGSDWLGLLDDDDDPDLYPSIPLKEPPPASATPRPAGYPPPGAKSENRTAPQPRTSQASPQAKANRSTPPARASETVPRAGEVTPVPRAGEVTPVPRAGEVTPVPRAGEVTPVPRPGEVTPVPRPGEVTPVPRPGESQPSGTSAETPAVPQEDDEWLISALARKKAQKQEKPEERAGQNPNGLKEDPARGTGLPWESPGKGSPSINAATPRAKGRPDTVPLAGPSDPRRDQIQLLPVISGAPESDNNSQTETLRLQSKIVDLGSQIRKLQLEKDQRDLLLETMQQRHKEDLEIIENAQRIRLKLLEDSALQREERLQKENQELSIQYVTRCQSAEREQSHMTSQYQRRLTDLQQEREQEIQRIRDMQRLSVQEMCRDHEDQLQRLKRVKDQEIDAVTSASSHTRSLNGIIEQMEAFSHKLGDLSVRVENTQINTSQELELGARQREGQLRALQERLTRQQKDMEEERSSLRLIIANMETRLSEQSRLLEQERWRVSAEQAKMESLQRSLEEQKRITSQQIAQEREELERAKSALLEEQQSVMTRCAEERRKLAAEWAELHTQQKLGKERAENDITRAKMAESQREGALISFAKEQAELKVQAAELRNKEEQLSMAREALEKERQELRLEKDRVYATAMRVHQRAEEVESMSKLALQRQEEGENAAAEAKKVEGGHQERLRIIQQQLERLRQQEEHLMEERKNLSHQRRQLNQLRQGMPAIHTDTRQATSGPDSMYLNASPLAGLHSRLATPGIYQDTAPQPSDLYAKLALLRLSAQRDRDFLEDEQLFLEALKRSNVSDSQTV